MKPSDLPNLISIARILLVWPLAWAVATYHYLPALALFGVAALSDGADGFLARRYGWVTPLGAALDPVADKLLLVTSFLLLGWQGHLPGWLVAAVIGRDLLIVGGALAYRLLVEPPVMSPSLLSKANTVLQIALVCGVFLSLAGYPPRPAQLQPLHFIVLATTLLSGADYVWTWSRRAVRRRQGESV